MALILCRVSKRGKPYTAVDVSTYYAEVIRRIGTYIQAHDMQNNTTKWIEGMYVLVRLPS